MRSLLSLLMVAAVVLVTKPSPTESSPLKILNEFYKTNRFKGAFLTCALKGCSADLVAQTIAAKREQREEEVRLLQEGRTGLQRFNPIKRNGPVSVKKTFSLDVRRTLVFLIYGGFYQGCVLEIVYNDILPLLGKGTDVRTVAKKVAADMGFISPLITIPMAYLVKGLLLGNTPVDSIKNYYSDVVHEKVVLKNWMIFVPVQCLTFSVVPEHLRVSFVACVSFFWMILLSCILSS